MKYLSVTPVDDSIDRFALTFVWRQVRHMNLHCAWKLGRVRWYCLLPETFYTSINWAYWKTRTWDPLETLAGPCNIQ